MKIGFISSFFCSWGGGVDFLANLIQAMAHYNTEDELYVFLPKETKKQLLKRTLSNAFFIKKWIKYNGLSTKELFDNLGNLPKVSVIYSSRSVDEQVLDAERNGIDIVLPCFSPPEDTRLPWVGYIYDCQHKYYPEYFCEAEVKNRDISFQLMLDKATDIIVNANSVFDDLHKFYNVGDTRIHTLPFSPFPNMHWFSLEPDCTDIYGIENEYFIICNQFWKHKGHLFAFKAFSEYVRRDGRCDLICTGKLLDHTRTNIYPNEILDTIKKLQLQDRIKLVGYVSKEKQIKLLKGAKALIQPTLFEGGPGGGASYNAIALGVPVIASDIPVNLEMESEIVHFFSSSDINSLVNALLSGEHFVKRAGKSELVKNGEMNQGILAKYISLILGSMTATHRK